MIKILHVSISSDIGGGPEHVYQLINGLSKTDFENHVACPENGPYYDRLKLLSNDRILSIPSRKLRIGAIINLYKYIRRNKIDIIHGHGKGAGLYCRIISIFYNIYAIHTPHGINQEKVSLSGKIYLSIEKKLSHLINSVIYVSQTESDYAKSIGMWIGVKSKIIFNGTRVFSDEERCTLRAKRAELNWASHKVVITASRFDFQKNTIEFCEIAAKFPKMIFAIIGDGAEKTKCEDYCIANGINNVEFIGFVLNPISYLGAADIYLSTARWEGLSMAILESMALGLPIIASQVIGNIDLIVPAVNGFLYKLGNINEAEEKLNQMLNPSTYEELSANSIQRHNVLFSANQMCQNTGKLYTEVFLSKNYSIYKKQMQF